MYPQQDKKLIGKVLLSLWIVAHKCLAFTPATPAVEVQSNNALSSSRLFSSKTNYMEKRAPIPYRRQIPQEVNNPGVTASQNSNSRRNLSVLSAWSLLKNGIYGTYDVLSSIASKMSSIDTKTSHVELGYHDMIEQSQDDKDESVDVKLQRQYQMWERENTSDMAPPPTVLNDVKNVVYSTIDGIGNIGKMISPETKSRKAPIDNGYTTPNSQKSQLKTKTEMQRLTPSLASPDTFTRLRTGQDIKNLQSTRTTNTSPNGNKLTQTITLTKQTLYTLSDLLTKTSKLTTTTAVTARDTLSRTSSTVKHLPARTNRTLQSLQSTLTTTVQTLNDTVATAKDLPVTIPRAVSQRVTNVTTSVTRTRDETYRVLAAVRAAPNAAREKVLRTKEDIVAVPKRVGERVAETKRGVDAAVTNVKILAGVEKRPVRPPTRGDRWRGGLWKLTKGGARVCASVG
eukprot:CAMPEP_0172504688 /NCGR_PEP_ID=MMETSP1066-20121228/180525_1 /TAXON_ID=671091 /ORGANISM="Coscinodiscus wailesii, Strain CCMP2513" /LENGTH=455 /DNA_ID=CAMNT_0013280965 /DNA_START=135 /DNA_END=1499 /DNA_ORIENTATION=-